MRRRPLAQQVSALRAVLLVAAAGLALLAAAVPASAAPVGATCETVASGPDFVMLLCVDPGASCRVYTITYGHEGETTTRCVLA